MADTYAVKTNELNKAVELNLSCTKLGRDAKHGCHMRAFWASTSSFFLAFVGWFALAPVAVDVAHSISICENQLYPPMENPSRTAFLKFKTVDGGIAYCTHGKVGEDKKPTDCKPVPAASTAAAGSVDAQQYNFKILPKCVCTPGTHCDDTLTYSAIIANTAPPGSGVNLLVGASGSATYVLPTPLGRYIEGSLPVARVVLARALRLMAAARRKPRARACGEPIPSY